MAEMVGRTEEELLDTMGAGELTTWKAELILRAEEREEAMAKAKA